MKITKKQLKRFNAAKKIANDGRAKARKAIKAEHKLAAVIWAEIAKDHDLDLVDHNWSIDKKTRKLSREPDSRESETPTLDGFMEFMQKMNRK